MSESSQGSIDRTSYQGAFGPSTVDPEDVREHYGHLVLLGHWQPTEPLLNQLGRTWCGMFLIVDNPTSVWFVGPLFASLTGLVFKEGLCYGKLEVGILTFVIPTVLGHLTGMMDDGVKLYCVPGWLSFLYLLEESLLSPLRMISVTNLSSCSILYPSMKRT
ncbi:hypothetical protein CRYUN_Cryun04dG0117200 [Craigia yunnanensis]